MTATDLTAPATDAGAGTAGAPPKLRRRPALAILGIGLIAAGGLTTAAIVTALDSNTAVVVPAEAIYRGQQITAEDLTTAPVSGLPGAALIGADDADTLIGQTAATDLPAGVPITSGSVTSQPVPAPGTAVVGLLLTPAQVPTVTLTPGDAVRIVATPRLQDDPPGTDQVASVSATVVSTTTDEVSGNTIVNVATASEDSAGLAALAATGRIALILDGAGE